MAQTNINIRIDKDLKKQFEFICNELGMSMTTAMNIFAKAFVRYKGMPFALSINDYNKETRNTIENIEKGIGLVGPFHSTKDLMKSLMNEDDE